MKKIFLIIVFLLITSMPVQAKTLVKQTIGDYTISAIKNGSTVKIKWNGKTIHIYNSFHGKIKIISERKLTYWKKTHRKNKTLYIERVIGKVKDDNLNGITTSGGYINYYRSLKGIAHKGDVIISYCVYSPYNNAVDDIDERYDFVL